MTLSEAKLAANNRYLQRNYEIVSVKTRRDKRYNDRINRAAEITGKTKRQYIIDALDDALNRDSVQLDDLTD